MNGICTIDIEGQPVGFKFGMPAMRMIFSVAEKPDYMDIASYNALMLAHVLHAGYTNNCYIKGTEPKYDFEFFCDLVDSAMSDKALTSQIENASKVFLQAKFIKNVKEVSEEVAEKKSPSTGKKSKEKPMEISDLSP